MSNWRRGREGGRGGGEELGEGGRVGGRERNGIIEGMERREDQEGGVGRAKGGVMGGREEREDRGKGREEEGCDGYLDGRVVEEWVACSQITSPPAL